MSGGTDWFTWRTDKATYQNPKDSADNAHEMERLQRGIRTAIAQELTARQRETLELYMSGMKMPAIAAMQGVDRSTVSRTISRAKRRIQRYLKYAFEH